jgi:hypothetical protein
MLYHYTDLEGFNANQGVFLLHLVGVDERGGPALGTDTAHRGRHLANAPFQCTVSVTPKFEPRTWQLATADDGLALGMLSQRRTGVTGSEDNEDEFPETV